MNKEAFLTALSRGLSPHLALSDVKNSLDYYEELIADRMEEGMTEEAAVAAVGAPEAVAEQILAEIPMTRLVKRRLTPKHPTALFWVLLIAGSPVWLALGAAALAILVSVYAVLVTLLVCYYAVLVACFGGALLGAVSGVYQLSGGNWPAAAFYFGCGLVLLGLGLLLLPIAKPVTKGLWQLAVEIPKGIRALLLRKEAVR